MSVGSSPGANDIYYNNLGAAQSATVALPLASETVYATLNSLTASGWIASPSVAYAIQSPGALPLIQSPGNPAANVSNNGQEVLYVFGFSNGDPRAMADCWSDTAGIRLRIAALTINSATLGFTAQGGTPVGAFDWGCDCDPDDPDCVICDPSDPDCNGGGGGGGVGDATPEIDSISPQPLQAGSNSTQIVISGSFFGPSRGGLDVGGSGGCQLLNILSWTDSGVEGGGMISALISVPSSASWTACTIAVESTGTSGNGFQPSDSSSSESAPFFDEVDPDLPNKIL